MARSHYIYTVTPAAGYVPQGAFTVKHEMVTWMKRKYPGPDSIKVHRYPDGGYAQPDEGGVPVYRTEMDVHKLWDDE